MCAESLDGAVTLRTGRHWVHVVAESPRVDLNFFHLLEEVYYCPQKCTNYSNSQWKQD